MHNTNWLEGELLHGRPSLGWALTFCLLLCPGHCGMAQGRVELKIRTAGSRLELRWPAQWVSPSGVSQFPYFEVQQSSDLRHWQPIGQKLHGSVASPSELIATMDNPGATAFYRVAGALPAAAPAGLAANGAQMYGYAPRFAEELGRLGQISPGDFARIYGLTNEYLPGLSWDPTTAKFWDLFSQNPNFQLNAQELSLFKTNGLVVSKRLGAFTFADLYYRIYTNDLPVFVSTDAILQAWHRSYDNMLKELEETWLFSSTDRMLAAMAAQIPSIWDKYGSGALRDSIRDVDYYLTVARSLLAGTNAASALPQGTRVAATLAAVKGAQLQRFNLFGEWRMVDFSQFTVRGHYTESTQLAFYFQAMMWLGRIDFRMAGGPFDDGSGFHYARPRELGAAIVLYELLSQAGQFDSWAQMDRLLHTLVGWVDSLTFAQLGGLLAAANIQSLGDIPDLATLERLQAQMLEGQLGFQNIRSDWFVSPYDPEQMVLPRSFTVLGQRFVPDSWALDQLVYDNILWVGSGQTNKVMRRIPSALDVAFSTLGNSQIVPELVTRMTNSNGRQFRDGLPYQHNLAAVRNVLDHQDAAVWEDNIYSQWVAALRQLSIPATAPEYPEAMRTRAWAMKDLNTQLASWTELRHDTLLYAKPSYTGLPVCLYPTGFVEPRVDFWQRLQALAQGAAELIRGNIYRGTVQIDLGQYGFQYLKTIDLSAIQSNQIAFLEQFADTVATLKGISTKELNQRPLSHAESDFLVNLIQSGGTVRIGCVQQRTYDGWYPQMFYRSYRYRSALLNPSGPPPSADILAADTVGFHENAGSGRWDALVADIHTDPPAPIVGDPGSVLHEGVGNVDLLLIAIDNGPDRMVFAGPVLSHYEFELIGSPTRKSDPDWKSDYRQGRWPAPPEWTRSYLVPGTPPGFPPW